MVRILVGWVAVLVILAFAGLIAAEVGNFGAFLVAIIVATALSVGLISKWALK